MVIYCELNKKDCSNSNQYISLAPGQSRTIECNNINLSHGNTLGRDIPVRINLISSVGAIFNQDYGSVEEWCDPQVGIILPFNEKLCWQKNVSSLTRNFSDSLEYCSNLNLGGYNWRLPIDLELLGNKNSPNEGSLLWWMNEELGYEQGSHAMHRNYGTFLNDIWGFIGVANGGYWSKTIENEDLVWRISLFRGLVTTASKDEVHQAICMFYKNE